MLLFSLSPACPATPTPTPTPYHPNTSLDFNGTHSGLKAVMFWAIFRESNLDVLDSGSPVDNFDLGTPRFSTFLFSVPYYNPGMGLLGDSGAEPPPPIDPTNQDWYIRHAPFDYRYMAAQTMINGFLNYERRFGISRVFEYAKINFSGSIGSPTIFLWNLDPACQFISGTDYGGALASSNPGNNYGPAIDWLNGYTNCIASSNSQNYSIIQARRAIASTLGPQIQQSVNDFYNVPSDFTDGSFQLKVINYGVDRILQTCVGGCYINGDTNTVIYTYEVPKDVFTSFAVPLESISQFEVSNGYSRHMQQIGTYNGAYHSVAQPVLVRSVDLETGNILGYVWETAIVQQSSDMIHVPR